MSQHKNIAWRQLLAAAGFVIAAGVHADSPAPAAHSDSVGAAITDTAITAKVKARLTGDRLGKSDISVTTTNGVVTLNGTAASADAKSYAEDQAKAVDGVKSVDDQLAGPSLGATVAADTGHAAATTKRVVKDSWITTKVKSEILADSVSKGFKVGVKTRHGVVTLKGTLANDDAVAHVKDLVSQVQGVKSVDASMLKSAS